MAEDVGFRRNRRAGDQRRDGTQQVELGAQGAPLERHGARQLRLLGGQRRPPRVGALAASSQVCV